MTPSHRPTNSYVTLLASVIVKWRIVIVLSFAVLLAVATYFLPSFRINASADTLLVKNNALYIETQLINQRFSPDEFILVAYKPRDGNLFSQRSFKDLQLLSTHYRTLERVGGVTSMLTVPLPANADALSGSDISSLTWEQQHYSQEHMKALLTDHPLYTDLLVNQAQTAAAIQIVFRPNADLAELESKLLAIQRHALDRDLTPQEKADIESLQRQADPLRQAMKNTRQQEIEQILRINQQVAERADTYLGGSYVVGHHLINIIKSDLVRFGAAIAAIIALLLLIIYRRVRWVVFPLLACAISVCLTIGLFGALDLRATVISANFIALQLILTLAVMIHLIGSYRDIARERAEDNQQQRVISTLQRKLAPCFYASLTTSVGFGSLTFSGIQPVVDFGYMMLLAMLVTMCVSLLWFPALLSLLKPHRENDDYALVKTCLSAIRHNVAHAPLRTALIATLLFALLCPGLLRLNVENSFINYFAEDTQVHQELKFIDQQFGGSTPLDITITAPQTPTNDNLLVSADQINQLHTVHAAVEAFPATGNMMSVINFTTLARQLNDNKPLTEYELNTLYLMLDEHVADQLIGAYLVQNPLALRISTRIQDTTPGLDRETFLAQLKQDLASLGLGPDEVSLTSLFVLYQDILSRLIDSQINTLGLVYLALAIILLLIFRSIKISLIALIPNIVNTLGIVGLIGWLNIPLDLMTITIAAIAMGIAIDDTIHFTHSYLQAPAGSALQHSFSETGLPMLFTSTIIAVGFAMFGFSSFLPSVYFGLLTAAAMLMALAADLTLLPALLYRFADRQRE